MITTQVPISCKNGKKSLEMICYYSGDPSLPAGAGERQLPSLQP
jgi:hypothetical protein